MKSNKDEKVKVVLPTSGMVQKGGSGSVSNTSSIAPPNHPSLWQRIAAEFIRDTCRK